MNKQTKGLLIGAIVLVILAIIILPKLGIFEEKADGPKPQAGNAVTGPEVIPVQTVVLKKKELANTINVTGNILANEVVNLQPEIAGKITRITFKEGEKVKKGQPLVYLNDEEQRAQLERLTYSQKLFEISEERQRKLLEREAISQAEYDQALTELNTNLSDIKVVEAQINKSIIKAPFDGVIGLRQVSEGSFISTADNIATIVSIDPVKIEFSIPERYAGIVRVGNKIAFTNDAIDGEATGEVYAIEPNINVSTRTLTMRALSPNRNGALLPGMFVNIKLILDVEQNTITIPTQSLIPELGGFKVFVVKDGKAKEQQVKIGLRTAQEIQITEGLSAGDTVLTTGILAVKTGSPVKIVDVQEQ